MKNKTKVISIILFLSVFVMLVSCQKQRTDWKGTIEEENGVTVVKNPIEPLYGELVFDLEEDLSIGKEGDDNYMFYRIADIKSDDEGNIFVVDYGNYRIQKFDSHGNYLQTIGRQGQGPGEFERPLQLLIGKKNMNLYVHDFPRLKIFDKSGNYLKDSMLKNYPREFIIDEEENMLGVFLMSSESGSSYGFCKANLQGEIIQKYGEFPFEITTRKSGDSVIATSTGFEHALHFSKIDDQSFIYGYSKEYELIALDKEGNLLFKIKKDGPPDTFTAEEKRKFKGMVMPEHKPYFYSIFEDDRGRIYVQKDKGAQRKLPGPKECDIFSKDGFYLYKTTLPHPPYLIEKGYFYTRIINEDTGEYLVKRFKIKNWDQIKEGI